MGTNFDITSLDFSKSADGLIPAIAQDCRSGKILMLAFVNREAVEKSMATGFAHFYSRSREKLWKKGEESGNILSITGIATDCDGDALIYSVESSAPACHTGERSCFFRGDEIVPAFETLAMLESTIKQRQVDMPEKSYVADLFRDGLDRIAQKVGEEGVETVIAAKNSDREECLNESADLLFHLLILLRFKECSLTEVLTVLKERIR